MINTQRSLVCLLLIHILSGATMHGAQQQNTPHHDNEKLRLNFVNASLDTVVEQLAAYRKINYIPKQDLASHKVTLISEREFTAQEAWDLLHTLLNTKGFSITNVDGMYRVTTKDASNKQPLPSFIGDKTTALPNTDEVIRYVYLFRNIKVDHIQSILDKMLPSGSVLYNKNLNLCQITAPALSIKNAMEVIGELDTGGLRESIQVVELHHAQAETVAKLFNEELIGKDNQKQQFVAPSKQNESSYFSNTTRIIPNKRNNSLILLGTSGNIKRIINFTQKHLDKPLDAPESRLHIMELKYVRAENIKPILDSIVQTKSGPGDQPYFEDVIISAEASQSAVSDVLSSQQTQSVSMGTGNRLIIACNKEDWRRLKKFIVDLDKPQPQIAVEVLIVEVDHEQTKNLAAQLQNKTGILGNGVNMETQHIIKVASPTPGSENLIAEVPGQTGGVKQTSFLTFGSQGTSIWAIAQSVFKIDRTNIISQPYFVATNNKESSIAVTTKRLEDGDLDTSSGQTIQNKEWVSATLNASITPRINSSGVINMILNLKIDDFNASLGNPADRDTRSINTNLTLNDGEVFVTGGLTRNTDTNTLYKTPLLGDVPIVGNLFRSKTRTRKKEDLFIFLRPTIIKPNFEGAPDAYTRLKLDYAHLNMRRHHAFNAEQDPIQRWMFKSSGKPSTLFDNQIPDDIRRVQDFATSKQNPRNVRMEIDPHYRSKTSHQIEAYKEHLLKESTKPSRATKRRKRISHKT